MVNEVHIVNDLGQLRVLNDFVDRTIESFGLNQRMSMPLFLALEEAVVNIIMYAYPGEQGKDILIRMEREEEKLTVTLVDSGVSFDPTAQAEPDTTLSLEDRPIGGLGIHLIKKLMTEVYYCREGDKNVLTMVKELNEYG
ncbi:serine/threonine-protein kinase RsbW [Parabacteroides sp. PFB2-12]|uniref:ATP-binding protein n=1 Tax=unclassified Parabacteroides TaxID=2649774 RepID=UPI00247641CE|nr:MULTISPECIES: ATP-binding protein [unclassified Parabacteroides]MDH6343124.1 serine/threonine-protein kinase RsbW [Parabacteroides sp. PM6-13]MDH6390768.1 serine/threonine-protein kinase RsbW [Parabacteroides sp. PFB2-12]